MNRKYLLTVLLSLLAISASTLRAAEHQHDMKMKTGADPKPYPLGTCVVSGEKLGGDMGEPVVFVHEGREIKLCCNSCRKDFDADITKFLAKVDAAAKKVKRYPLKTCLVSGEKLGGMGKPLVFVQDLQEIKLCCKSCKKDFDKEVKRYMRKVKQATEKAQAADESHDHLQHQH
jgi:peptidoglycan hydrolase CwlO-like protein